MIGFVVMVDTSSISMSVVVLAVVKTITLGISIIIQSLIPSIRSHCSRRSICSKPSPDQWDTMMAIHISNVVQIGIGSTANIPTGLNPNLSYMPGNSIFNLPLQRIWTTSFMPYGLCLNAPPLETIPRRSVPCPYLNVSRCPICNEPLRRSNDPEQYCEPCRSNGLHQWNMHIWQGAYTAIFQYGDHNSVEKCAVWLRYGDNTMELNHHFKDGKDWHGNYRSFWSTNVPIGTFDFNPQDYPQTIRQIETIQYRRATCGICDAAINYEHNEASHTRDDHFYETSYHSDGVRYEYLRNARAYGVIVYPSKNKMTVYGDGLAPIEVACDAIVFDPKHPDELIEKIDLLETFA
jgi:hypothetical protein